EEYRRLLYVGMTRAEDRLIVCGYHGLTGPDENGWHRLVSDALAGESISRRDEGLGCEILHYAVTPSGGQMTGGQQTDAGSAPAPKPLPDWLGPLPPAPEEPPLPLAPSGLGAEAMSRQDQPG